MRLFTIFLTALTVLTACGGDGTTAPSEAEAQTPAALRVAVMPTLDCLPLYVAESMGWLDEGDADVRLVRYTAHMDCDTAIARRAVDGTFTDLIRAERLRQAGVAISYATATSLSWQLLASRTARIRQLKQLDDKMVGMTRYSATALLADRAVDSAKLKSERVFRIQVNDVNLRLSMLEVNNIDALLLPEPQATQARNIKANTLLDTRRLDVQLGALTFRDDAMSDTAKHRQVELLMAAYDRACDSINAHGTAYYRDIITSRCGVTQATVDSLPTSLTFTHASAPRQKDIDLAREWLRKQ